MTTNNQDKKPNAVIDAIKKQAIGILIGLVALVYTTVKELISTGAEVKHKQFVVNIVTTDRTIEDHFDTLINKKIQETMSSPAVWFKVFDNSLLKEYTSQQTSKIRSYVDKKIKEVDSIQNEFYNELGVLSGDRNENVLKTLGAMMREYNKKHLNTVHVPAM